MQRPDLPLEVVREVILHLNTVEYRKTLLSMLRVSSECWDAAARILYRNIKLNQSRFAELLAAGRPVVDHFYHRGRTIQLEVGGDISWRMRRAFTFVERLHIIGPLASTDLVMLWNMTNPGTALFPQVRHLRLEDNSGHCQDRARLPPEHEEIVHKAIMNDHLALFDRPDVCVCGLQSGRQVPWLVKRVGTIITHGLELLEVIEKWKSLKPLEGQSCRIFHAVYEGMGYALGDLVRKTIPRAEGLLEGRGPQECPYEILCLGGVYDWDRHALGDRDPVSKDVRTTRIDVTVKLFDRDEISECAPCTVCGRLLRYRMLG